MFVFFAHIRNDDVTYQVLEGVFNLFYQFILIFIN